MKVVCRHGHYAFYPEFTTEISSFASYFKITLTRYEDFFTFPLLKDLLKYSIKGKVYSNALPAIANFEGSPWDVMRANSMVYSLDINKLVPRTTIVTQTPLPNTGDFFLPAVPIVQAGALSISGKRIVDYIGFFIDDYTQLRLSEVGLV